MKLRETDLAGVVIVELDDFTDDRGSFMETYDAKAFAKLGVTTAFVQDSCSVSRRKGTVRGLHFQTAPRAQDKLVRVTRGRLFDVMVDLRPASPNYKRWMGLELSAHDRFQVLIPKGFAHGFCTLEANTEITYKMSDHFSLGHYAGVRWNDPDLAIDWPVAEAEAVLSERDKQLPLLRELPPVNPFE
ncbi:MAG: dTDP-4-dehydrorhamnose 3,5-epimerase [Rhodospirillaceae bacterium]